MADDKFFNDKGEEIDAPAQETETFKLGDKEYTQEELQSLVGLGEQAREVETKYSTKLDRVFPEYTKASQERAELKKKNEELEARLNPSPAALESNTNGLTPQAREEAIKQLKELGFVSKEEAQQFAFTTLQADKLVNRIDSFISTQQEAGNPVTSRDELLTFMATEGIKNPEAAYKIKFESELDAIKEKKLGTIKPNGMVTTEASTAGSKNPVTVKVTKDNLAQVVASMLPVD